RVHSFDYDPDSVRATQSLKAQCAEGNRWSLEEGSVLDHDYMRGLGDFDVVYSWGVLHHTGKMWEALSNACDAVAGGGRLYITLYNDMGPQTQRWRAIKKTYCSLPALLQPLFAGLVVAPAEVKELAKATLRLRPQEYVRQWTRYRERRGMSKWRDIIDWVGGYPYEAAGADAVVAFCTDRGFEPVEVRPTKGLGCNEFLFRRTSS
ncbi:MAG: class I SAM-dependent methyltransferase, partial [Gemmatimonadetes bacterium]|nr:class I SAM-dependent methyltransferase [Gemmatimonadota bacterium]